MGDKLLFFKNFLSRPGQIGSVIPSSPFLVAAVLDGVDFATARTVVEYGPGTGVFTGEILRRLHPEAKFLCIELSDDFYAALAARFHDPRMILVHGSAADVAKHLADHGLPAPDAIVCGLPLTSLPDGVRRAILTETVKVLKPESRFVLFQYTLIVLGLLQRYFGRIQKRHTLLNLPPAYALYCDQPLKD